MGATIIITKLDFGTGYLLEVGDAKIHCKDLTEIIAGMKRYF